MAMQIKNYLQLVNILEDATLVIKKEKAEESKRSEQSGQMFNVLLLYIQKLKMQGTADRNLLQAKDLASKISTQQVFSNIKLKSELRPQNVIRFLEKALKALRTISNLEKESADPTRALEFEF